MCTCFWNLKGATKASLLIPWQRNAWGGGAFFIVYTLWKWNVIMYANVTLPLTLDSNKLNVQFFSVLFQWEKFRRVLWKLVSEKGAKIKEKDAWLLCGRVSASLNAKPLPEFSFRNSRFPTEKIVAFVKVRVFVSSRIRQYDMPSIAQWLRIRCHVYVWYRYTLIVSRKFWS